MNQDYARTLALLRKDKGISQRQAAADLGVSQALLSHYEKGVREPGLAFVRRACDYYHASADYMLGRTLSRDGVTIEAEEVLYFQEGKDGLHSEAVAASERRRVVNANNFLFELLAKIGNQDAIGAAGRYLSGAIYQLCRILHKAGGGNEQYFSLSQEPFAAGAVEAGMQADKVEFTLVLQKQEGKMPTMEDSALTKRYPGLVQSTAQVLHGVEMRTNEWLENADGGRK